MLRFSFFRPELKRYFLTLTTAVQLLLPYANAEAPAIVEDSLVNFYPAVHTMRGPECQGVRIARNLLVTSPLCAQAINKKAQDSDIHILDSFENTQGKVVPVKGNQSLNPMDHDMLLDISEAVANEHDTYPVLRNSDTPIPAGFAYFKDQNGVTVKKRVSVTQLFSSDTQQRFYDVSADGPLPSGTVVMDDKNHLVCLISIKGRCVSVPLGQVLLTRKLEQYGEPGDSSDMVASLAPIIAEVGTVLVVITGAVGVFYGALFIRSKQLGIPTSTFWGGMCGYGYCKGGDALSGVLCALGSLCFIPTGGYSGALCWAGPFVAAWNWLNQKHAELFPTLIGFQIPIQGSENAIQTNNDY